MANFDLDALIEFNPALIYVQQSERSQAVDPTDESHPLEKFMIPTQEQIQDLYEGYQYLQNEVLPLVKAQGRNVLTVERLREWMNTFHGKLAHGLARQNRVLHLAGCYTVTPIFSWHHGEDFHLPLMHYFSDQLPLSQTQFVDLLVANQVADKKSINGFLTLCERLYSDPTADIYPQEREYQRLNQSAGAIALKPSLVQGKLCYAFWEGRLSEKEIAIVNKFVKICPPPHLIGGMMNEFYQALISQWQDADPTDDDAIIDLAAFAFARQLDIHPYFNANKRTCTGLMNLILRSFNKPSILLFHPNEDGDDVDNSLVGQAVAALPEDRRPLKALIKQGIDQATIRAAKISRS